MSNYFQKIVFRSTGITAKSSPDSSYILPQSSFLYDTQTASTEEKDQPANPLSESITAIDKPAPEKRLQDETSSNKNPPVQPTQEKKQFILPVTDPENYAPKQTAEEARDETQNKSHGSMMAMATEDNAGLGNILQPTVTIIEKISRRNFQNTVIEKQNTEKGLQAVTDAGVASLNSAVPDKAGIIQPLKDKSSEEKKSLTGIIHPGKYILPIQPSQKIKGKLQPVHNENIRVTPVKKSKQENKLVIGRLTVEVINQVQPPVKKEPIRQSNTVKPSNTTVSNINKFSFGLSQL